MEFRLKSDLHFNEWAATQLHSVIVSLEIQLDESVSGFFDRQSESRFFF